MAELGNFALILGFFLAGYAVLIDVLGAWRKDRGLIDSGRNATIASLGCLTVATIALWVLLISGDFSVSYVADHTSKACRLLIKSARSGPELRVHCCFGFGCKSALLSSRFARSMITKKSLPPAPGPPPIWFRYSLCLFWCWTRIRLLYPLLFLPMVQG